MQTMFGGFRRAADALSLRIPDTAIDAAPTPAFFRNSLRE